MQLTAPGQQDRHSDGVVLDQSGDLLDDALLLLGIGATEQKQEHTVHLVGHKTVVRLRLSDHMSFAAGKFPANAKTLALCRLQLEAMPTSMTNERSGRINTAVSCSIGRINTAVICSTPPPLRCTVGVDARNSPPVALLDLPSHLLEQILGNKCLDDREIWGEHGIVLTCSSVCDLVSREEFFACRYCFVWPWARKIAQLPEQLPCHLRPVFPFATTTLGLQSRGSIMNWDERKPMRSAYMHARLRDVAAGRESFPVVAIGWQVEQRPEEPDFWCHQSPDERVWINESSFSWRPYAAGDESGPWNATLALPLAFEYTRGDPTLQPASLRQCDFPLSIHLVMQRRLAALEKARNCPPLLHLTHHIIDHHDDVVTFRNAECDAPHPNFQTSIAAHTRPVAGDPRIGQPFGWGVTIDERVPADTVLGEYVGVHHPCPTSLESAADDDTTHLISSHIISTATPDHARRVQHAMKQRKRMYMLHLQNGGSIRPHNVGNWTRFINHSYAPNVRYEEWSVPTGEPPTVIVAFIHRHQFVAV